MSERLKLRARDGRDLETFASIVQDALVPLSDMVYLPREQLFALMLNRFRWEAAETSGQETSVPAAPRDDLARDVAFADQRAPAFERVHSALVFERVLGVKRRGLEKAARGGLVELLTMRLEEPHLLLAFAGDAAVRLEIDQLSCHLEDLGEPWPTLWRPQHADRETPGGRR
jgi:hypothetical protein